jgi:hypothetical protein
VALSQSTLWFTLVHYSHSCYQFRKFITLVRWEQAALKTRELSTRPWICELRSDYGTEQLLLPIKAIHPLLSPPCPIKQADFKCRWTMVNHGVPPVSTNVKGLRKTGSLTEQVFLSKLLKSSFDAWSYCARSQHLRTKCLQEYQSGLVARILRHTVFPVRHVLATSTRIFSSADVTVSFLCICLNCLEWKNNGEVIFVCLSQSLFP